MLGLRIHKVVGDSMSPTYQAGDYVFSFASWCWPKYRCGDVVVVRHADYGDIIKRVNQSVGNGFFSICGDGSKSLSSKSLGYIHVKHIIGKVCFCLPNPEQYK